MEILFSKLSEPSLFLLIQVRKDPEGSVKIDLQSVKSLGFFLLILRFVFGCLFYFSRLSTWSPLLDALYVVLK